MNRHLDSQLETIFLMPNEKYFYTSSHLIKQVHLYGERETDLVPANASWMPFAVSSPRVASRNRNQNEQRKRSLRERGKESTFGVVFLIIFLDMVGFFGDLSTVSGYAKPLSSSSRRKSKKAGGFLKDFVSLINGMGFDQEGGNNFLRFETVVFGGVLGSLYAILQFFFAPVWGRLSDKFGRRPILLLTVGGTCLGYLLWVFAGSFWVLVLSRVVGGVASGNLSVATASIAGVTSRESRSKGMAFVGVAFGLGFILGPALGGWASTMDPFGSDAQGVFVLNEFSLAAVISSGPRNPQLGLVGELFQGDIAPGKAGDCQRPKASDFSDWKSLQYRRSQNMSLLSFLHDFV